MGDVGLGVAVEANCFGVAWDRSIFPHFGLIRLNKDRGASTPVSQKRSPTRRRKSMLSLYLMSGV